MLQDLEKKEVPITGTSGNYLKKRFMNNIAIEKFCEAKKIDWKSCLRIDFKEREPLYGFIVAAPDYDYLKGKNLWRIVLISNISKWQTTGNLDFAKIFNGDEITKLSLSEKKQVA